MGLQRKLARRAAKKQAPALSPWPPILEQDDDLIHEEVVRRHPASWRRAYEDGTTLWASGEEFSPAAHFQMHLVVEKQLRDCEPPFVADAARRLQAAGVDDHEIRHLLALTVSNQLYRALKEKLPYDVEMHRREVDELVARYSS